MAWTKILVRGTNWLGDAVMSLAALRALRQRYPEARIAVLARGWVADLYRREPCVDEVLLALGGQRFDAVMLLPNSFKSALDARLAGIPRRIGYNRDGRGFLLTDRIRPPKPGETPPHERFYYLELLRRAGILDALPPAEPILLHAADEARRTGLALFDQMGMKGPVVGVSPGAQNSRAKQWLPERFAESAVRIAAALGGGVAIFGSPAERALCQRMAGAVRRAGVQVLSLAGETTLAQFIDLAAACRVFLTNDAGAMHVASALGVATVAVFGPTDFAATAPAGPVSRIVREPVECSPCMLRDCPIDHRCMTAITAERVAEAALELVK
ncbi:MAG: lipopolysaccharide heptosyltransferase II [Bryobacteraceae bacterium]